MIRGALKRYERYKDSGVEWLGEVPAHWEVKRLKDIGNSIIGITYSPEDVLDGGKEGVLVLRSSNIQNSKLCLKDTVFVNIRISKKQTVRQGDILICSRNGSRALIGKNIIIDEFLSGNTFGAFMTVYRSKYFRFIHKFFNSKIFESQSGLYMSSTVNQLTINTLNNFFIALPPMVERKSIAIYLDEKTNRIDRKIELLQAKADRYRELKQALINETVTRGLDPTVPMKDSGVEWIGEVPAHWKVGKIGHLFNSIGSGTTPKAGLDIYYKDGSINWINTGDLNDNLLFECRCRVTQKAIKDCNLKLYKPNSIIVAMYGATIGKVALSMIEGCVNQACCVLGEGKEINTKFMLYWFMMSKNYLVSLSYGGGQPNVSQQTIKELRLVYPELNEQQRIIVYLDTKTDQIEQIITTITTQIQTLQELRKTLINDVVTGKIKVV